MDAWSVFYVPIKCMDYRPTGVYAREADDWSELYPELTYDPIKREICFPNNLIRKPRNTTFGWGWHLKQGRVIMFLRYNFANKGYKLCFATRGSKLAKRLQSCGMTPIWIEPMHS